MEKKYSKEDMYRKTALRLINNIKDGRTWLSSHKPSLGYYGEILLITHIRRLLPKSYCVCQGFVFDITTKITSRQCDIIIYKKGGNVIRSFGDTKFINSKSVICVIEVKSSISMKTFHLTLNAFEKLAQMGITNTFVFIYGRLTTNCLSKWLMTYKSNNVVSEYFLSDNLLYDWSDKEWLPNTIISLDNNLLLSLSITPQNNGDLFGYSSYQVFDRISKPISNLQEFFRHVLHLVDSEILIDFSHFFMNEGIPLFRI